MMEIVLRESRVQKVLPGQISREDAEDLVRERLSQENSDRAKRLKDLEVVYISYRYQISYNSWRHLVIRVWPCVTARITYRENGEDYIDRVDYEFPNHDALIVFDSEMTSTLLRFVKQLGGCA